jgi:spermidine synthase
MKKLGLTIALFATIVLEGYVVLSSELLAIRQSIPFVGSGTDTISIIIAAVLMPLAFGYQSGGRFKPGMHNGKFLSIRGKLIKNIIISQIILLFGISFITLGMFFEELIRGGITNNIMLTTIYSIIFLVTPVYLLGQTIPLISNYFSKEELSKVTGKILFFSTLGSFFGAVFSTLVLMSTIGVHYTAVINFAILAALITLLSKNKLSNTVLTAWAIAFIGLLINNTPMMEGLGIVENNKYNTIMIKQQHDQTHLLLNNNNSSMMAKDGRRHNYIEFMEYAAIAPIWEASPPKNILVVGAGGFTIGHEDHNNHYDFVDIDKSLLEISEKYILKEKLSDNKTFHPVPARSFLTQSKTKYDVIILDAYLGDTTIPEHLATQEFFAQVKDTLAPHGVVVANFAQAGNFGNALSRNIDNTFRSVFKNVSRHVIGAKHSLWDDDKDWNHVNAIYLYKDHPDAGAGVIYTDNKNTLFRDKPQSR